MSFWKLPKRLQ